MRVPIPAIVVPLIVLLLYLFVPGLKERPWTALRVAGAVLAIRKSVAIAAVCLDVVMRPQTNRTPSKTMNTVALVSAARR